ncbi:organic hydroperoxide resistance protein [Pseudonocardia halophobica]|uniref:organic hydroperoxide resistance protein n=1 Tax=Pseudonocardia halophobica TaxID=29401 RepID=UPI003D8EE682
MVKVLYTAAAMSSGDARNGHVRSSDGLLDLDLATPKEMGGAGGATNPEQLFAAGYSACFHSALKAVARQKKIDITDSSVSAEVGIGPNDQGGFALTVALHAEIGGVDQATADELVQAAHQVCPYSNATRGNIPVTVDATVE